MELYLGYRHFEADIDARAPALTAAGAAGPQSNSLTTEAFHAVVGGARIKF